MKRIAPLLRLLLAAVINLGLVAAIGLPIRSYISPPGPQTPWFAWCIALSLQPLFVLQAVLFTRWVDRRPLTDLPLGFGGHVKKTTIWGVILTVGMMAVYVGFTGMAGVTTWHWNSGFAPAATVLAALMAATAGFGEEFLFRGYIMRTFDSYGPRVALIVSSLAFALIHTVVGRVNPLDLLALFLHGMLFGILAQQTKSLWPGITIHFVYNALTSVVWSGSATTALLAFDGSLGWTKWAYKAAMVIPYLLMVWLINQRRNSVSAKAAL